MEQRRNGATEKEKLNNGETEKWKNGNYRSIVPLLHCSAKITLMGKGMVFEELQVWQLAREMVKRVYGLTAGIKDYGFNDQLQRAAISVMNNIAEGYESGTSLLLKRYFLIAKGSCGEVRSMMYAGMDLGYINQKQGEELIDECKHLSSMIRKFIDSRSK